MTAPVSLSDWEYPWLAGLLPLTGAENALGVAQAAALLQTSASSVAQNNSQNQAMIERHNRAKRVDLPSLLPFPVTNSIGETVEQLAFAQLIVRTSHLESLGNDPGAIPLLETNGYQLPQSTANEPNFITALDGKITLLRVNDSRGNPLDPIGLRAPLELLQDKQIDASINQCPPLGYTAKSVSGAVGPQPSGQHPLNRPDPLASAESGGVKIAVIDTGIAKQPRTDKWLDNIAGPGRLNTDPLYPNLDPVSTADDFVLGEVAGHGTFVSGIIRQVHPAASIQIHGIFGDDVVAGDVDLATALLKAVDDGARVINLSLGTIMINNRPPVATMVALEMLAERDPDDAVVVVCASGNNHDSTPVYPAAFSRHEWTGGGVRVVAVAGLDQSWNGAGYSSHGDWVDCSCLSTLVLSTFVQGNQPHLDGMGLPTGTFTTYGPNPWALWTGTSVAAPQVAGAIARAARERGGTASAALDWLLTQGSALPDFGRVLQILPAR